MGDAELIALTRTAIDASFAEPPLRAALLERLGDGDGRPT
jgi:adenosine deaminase